MRPASGFMPDEERLYSVEHPHSTETHQRDVEIRAPRHIGGFRFFWRESRLPLWPILAICAGLVAVAFICFHRRVKGLEAGGLPRRRLADEDDDSFDSPPSPDLEQLCISLGHWVPAETSPGDPRQSPQMVEEFFEKIETEAVSGTALPVPGEGAPMETLAGAAAGGSGAEPPAPPARCVNDEEPGPSMDFSTLEALPHPASVTAPPALPSSKSLSAKELPQTRPKAKLASAGLMGVSGAGPSTSRPTPSLPPAQGNSALYLPPLLRLPALQPGVRPAPWDALLSPETVAPCRSSQGLLRGIREVLLLPSLDARAANDLVSFAEELAAYAMQRLRSSALVVSPSDAVRAYGLRFVIFSSLHSVGQVIGPPPPPWWQRVIDGVLKNYDIDASFRWPLQTSTNVVLAQDLFDALRRYKHGYALTLPEIAELERRLSRHPKTAFLFRPSK